MKNNLAIKTSNSSSSEVQDLILENGKKLYVHLAQTLCTKYEENNLWFVVGATQLDALKILRLNHPKTTFLVPGVGTQGGNSDMVIKYGMDINGYGLVINVSRGITALDEGIANLSDYLSMVKRKAIYFHKAFHSARKSCLKN